MQRRRKAADYPVVHRSSILPRALYVERYAYTLMRTRQVDGFSVRADDQRRREAAESVFHLERAAHRFSVDLRRSDVRHGGSKDSEIIVAADKKWRVTRERADGSFTRGHLTQSRFYSPYVSSECIRAHGSRRLSSTFYIGTGKPTEETESDCDISRKAMLQLLITYIRRS